MQRLALSGIGSRRGMKQARNVNKTISGDDRDRTGNLRLAKPALSQLSYVPGPMTQWAYLDSNQGPQLYQSCALAN